MTAKATFYKSNAKKEKKRVHVLHTLFNYLMFISMFFISLFFSDEIAHSVKSGLSLCANVIIPSVFPFIILSDLFYANVDFTSNDLFSRLFKKVFKINSSGMYAFILGVLFGFPLGVKCARDLYQSGYLSREETERLIGFCNNTGPAFLVCGVGLGLRGAVDEGILLYAIMVLSALISGIIFSIPIKKRETSVPVLNNKAYFSITSSVKNAGINTLNICSYLTFFACVCGMLRKLLGETYIYLSIIPFIEIGSATSILSKTALLSPQTSFALSALAIGFSGFSVHLQALSFLLDTDIRCHKYFLMKFFQGIISVPLAFLGYNLFF